jgi:adenylate kinase family enzyme
VVRTNGELLHVDNPEHMPDPSVIQEIREPMVRCFIMIPNESISGLMQLIMDKRGEVKHTESIDTKRVMLTTELPLNEILVDFVDKIKSMTRGYGSIDYEFEGYFPTDIVKLEIMLNNINKKITKVFNFIANEDIIIKRITGRYLCSNCGAIYNSFFNKPKVDDVCDKCGAKEFDKRADDNKETIINRINIFNHSNFKIVEFYSKKNLIVSVDALKSVPQIFEEIKSSINN